MPSGIYVRTKNMKTGKNPNSHGNVKGKHWKIKDTSNMSHTQSKETREKRRKKLIGIPIKEHVKIKIRKTLMGHVVTKETREKISKAQIGRKNPHSEEMKKNMRKATIKRLEKQYEEVGMKFPRIGLNETNLLNKKEKELGIMIARQYHVCGFVVDGYCEETNCVFEVYEGCHYCKKKIASDKERQLAIQEELKCDFIIIEDTHRKNK